jgi:GNAT superfamily N-acetyltransferase
MEPGDVGAVHEVTCLAFEGLSRRFNQPPDPRPALSTARIRYERCLATDPGGAWVAENHRELVGCSLAIVREGVWGLSLLVVRPDAQSSGVGRELLARAHAHANGARGRIVLASPDPRALRAYANLGLALHPALAARGRARPLAAPREVRSGTHDDLPLTVAVDRAVRGAAHGDDITAFMAAGCELLVLDGRGYAVVRDGAVKQLAAYDEEAAATLLRAALAAAAGKEAAVEWITGAQPWAIRPCLDAGLELRFDIGAVFLGGDVGPFAPYLPSGAYL